MNSFKIRLIHSLIGFCLVGSAVNGYAVLNIRITQGVEKALPIAVVPFFFSESNSSVSLDIAEVIRTDLQSSGQFELMPEADMPQHPNTYVQINFADWRRLRMENLLIGSVKSRQDGKYEVSFRLVDIYRKKQMAGFRILVPTKKLRFTAHHIADIVYEKLLGIRGAFMTQIAYIAIDKSLGRTLYKLNISDVDGYSPKILLESTEPLLSPSWSPNGRKLAYVSFEGKRSSIYIQEIATGKRNRVASYVGINSAPSWSPDGKKLAVTLSKDGNPNIYILYLESKLIQQVTQSLAIDTEPTWSVDGQRIAFTSDRGGSPQIYEVNLETEKIKRLTFEGNYNAGAVYSPDGNDLAMVHRGEGGGYHIATLNLSSDQLSVLTKSRLDESPSYAPNGVTIMYTTANASGSNIATVSTNGKIRQSIDDNAQEVLEPIWGPFLKY